MKLSEAIRAGAKIRPQGFGDVYVERAKPRRWWQRLFGMEAEAEKTTCALGAAFEAAGCEIVQMPQSSYTHPVRGENDPNETTVPVMQTPPEWNSVLLVWFDCPQCDMNVVGHRLIPHINDDHKWTRKEIALWVERQESRQPCVTEAPLGAKESEWPEVVG